MNPHLQNIQQTILSSLSLSNEEKAALTEALNNYGDESLEAELRKAKEFIEKQNRQIETEEALERVRARAIAMRQSSELPDVVQIVWQQLEALGAKERISDISIVVNDMDGVGFNCWYVIKNPITQQTNAGKLHFERTISWLAREAYKLGDTRNEDIEIELHGEPLFEWLDKMVSVIDASLAADIKAANPEQFFFYLMPFSYDRNAPSGAIVVNSLIQFPAEFRKVLVCMSKTFALVYRRYIELQSFEENAKEAIKQSALDRIRADIASMRNVKDLDRITPLIWNELTILGIPFIRCGVFIMNDAEELIQTFLSTPDGKALAAFNIPYTNPGNIQQVLNNWHSHKIYIDHWDEATYAEFAGLMSQYAGVELPQTYLKTLPAGGFYLHFVPFLQGMLYVGNTTCLNENEISLIQSVADAFSTAYARYEDFKKLEATNERLEQTFDELKSAQAQLIQSEKMASLGELTAGVAHEIQNPLNFINNFSEVNNDLIAELKTEMQKPAGERDCMLEDEILNDITQNNEKIAFHGKRADAIVKGMLQHSRKNTGQKELTDINALADEYVRLSFHGLRAKDKSFNSDFKTDFDSGIGKVSIIPQDIGRVLLNLLNNAFYAVNEKRKTADAAYHPQVTISTKKKRLTPENEVVEITIQDNGTGIPQNILDKIFQPFFTTKPSGQGTGLGLSLTYDIIKAQGGEIKIESKEGEGSTFTIALPV